MSKGTMIHGILWMSILMLGLSLTVYAQTDWTKYSGNPVLDLGSPGAWDDYNAYGSTVINDGGTYRMWYSGWDGGTGGIGYATSPDGISWTKYSGNPVLGCGPVGAWDGSNVYNPTVINDGGTYKMWYSGWDGGTQSSTFRIGYATSPDGLNWTKYSQNPVLDVGGSGAWDSTNVHHSKVIQDKGTYRMWYDGNDGTYYRIGYATSPDGISWTRYPGNPVLDRSSSGGWDDRTVWAPTVSKEGGTYRMWCVGYDGSVQRIGYATSPDGANWTSYSGNPVLDVGNSGAWDAASLMSPVVINDGGFYKMWYDGFDGTNWRIGYATSPLNYLELEVGEAPAGGYDFSPRQTLTLNWKVYDEYYGFTGSPRKVFLGAILSPESSLENRSANVSEVLGTKGQLFIYYATTAKKGGKREYGWHPYPPAVAAWQRVSFPVPGMGDKGTLNFTVPSAVNKRCVLVGAFLPFPVADTCEVSNGFNLP